MVNSKEKAITYFGNLSTRNGKGIDTINEMYKYEYEPGFLMNATKQVAGHFVKDVKSLFTKAILGNLHTFSLTQLGTQLSEAAKGNLIKTGMTAAQYVKTIKNNNNEVEKPNGNIYPTVETTKQKPVGDIYPNINIQKKKPIGNIFNKSTLANNL